MIQKLYSPVFCKIYAQDDYYNGTLEPLSQTEAAGYAGEIKDLIKKIELPDEKERGLMKYYGEADTVSEKVKSLFIDVEVINSELWGITAIDITEPLNPREMALLKEYITGQMSDGFGESLEQREIKTEDGELYVSLWDYGDSFYIDTAQEFSDRHGISVKPA